MHSIAYTTGLSGFIGKHLLPLLLQKFNKVINFRRNDKFEIYNQDGSFESQDCSSLSNSEPPKIFINLAALYEPNPLDFNELLNLFDSNVKFPIRIIERFLGFKDLKIIQISSYHQLLDYEFQNEYSLTKSLGLIYIKKRCKDFLNVFLFDTFGPNDNRNKVVDVFIKNILSEKSIKVPKNDVHINISHVEDVCNSLMSSLTMPCGDYCILSNDTITVKELSNEIMSIIGNKVSVEELPKTINYFSKINSLPKNIYLKSNSISFKENLLFRINELKQANIL